MNEIRDELKKYEWLLYPVKKEDLEDFTLSFMRIESLIFEKQDIPYELLQKVLLYLNDPAKIYGPALKSNIAEVTSEFERQFKNEPSYFFSGTVVIERIFRSSTIYQDGQFERDINWKDFIAQVVFSYCMSTLNEYFDKKQSINYFFNCLCCYIDLKNLSDNNILSKYQIYVIVGWLTKAVAKFAIGPKKSLDKLSNNDLFQAVKHFIQVEPNERFRSSFEVYEKHHRREILKRQKVWRSV